VSGGAEVGPRLFCRGFTVSLQGRAAVLCCASCLPSGSSFAGTERTCFVFSSFFQIVNSASFFGWNAQP
jgi:hypothetical protein